MNKLKRVLVPYLLPMAAAFLVVFAYTRYAEAAADGKTLCKQQYALCTSARCIPDPGNPGKAICFCDVETGPSMASVPCNELAPSTDKHGVRTVYSTFSFKQFVQGKKGLKCPAGTPWTFCLNKRCTVDPANPGKAICVCDIERTDPWMTLGGDCDPATCKNAYWSGAALDDFAGANAFLTRALGLEKSPATWCPEGR